MKLNNLAMILAIPFFLISTALAGPNFSSGFDENSYSLLTDKNPILSLERLIQIIDQDSTASAEEEAELLKLIELAKSEQIQFNNKELKELQKLSRAQKVGFWVAATPYMALAGMAAYAVDFSPWLVGAVATYGSYILFYRYPKEAYFSPDSSIQFTKRRIVNTILLAKIQLRWYEKSEGYPWPFNGKPDCEQSLNDTLNKYSIK